MKKVLCAALAAFGIAFGAGAAAAEQAPTSPHASFEEWCGELCGGGPGGSGCSTGMQPKWNCNKF